MSMEPAGVIPHVLPPPLGALLGRLPAYPGSALLAGALNLALAPKLPDDVKQMLADRKLRIHVRDARLTFDFTWNGQAFAARRAGGEADLTISANAYDFVQLAQRREDPDTLFFSRRLSTEGDTELGLVVKNTLDALELPVFDPTQWSPKAVLARFAPRSQTPGVGPRHGGGH
jgi:O2-independent ubiquinone biosynthesis accessory factor UbiT